MKGDMLDFDRFLAEKQKEYLSVRVDGRVYRVQRAIPALLPVLLARADAEQDRAGTGRVLMQLGDAMFGRKAIDGFCRAGMTAEELNRLIEQTLTAILDAEAGNAETLEDDPAAGEDVPAKK